MKVVKMLSYGLLILLGLIMAGGFVRGWQSQTPPGLGLLDGQLRACPDKPNCVSSQADSDDSSHFVAALSGDDWRKLQRAIVGTGGKIDQDDGTYLHATFTSALFRFVDDVEAVRAPDGGIHIRSASRVGHSDFGVNRKRVEAIRKAL